MQAQFFIFKLQHLFNGLKKAQLDIGYYLDFCPKDLKHQKISTFKVGKLFGNVRTRSLTLVRMWLNYNTLF